MSNKPKVLITQWIFPEAIQILEENLEIDYNQDAPLTKDQLIQRVRDKDGMVCLLTDDISADIINSSNLKVISNVAVGYNNIDVDSATNKNITVTNTPGVLTETTADLAFTLLMSTARRITEAETYLREGKFEGWTLTTMLGQDIHNKTLGIIGFGRIGQATARRGCLGFNMNILYFDEFINNPELDFKATKVDLDELLKKSDFVSIHVPLTDNTKHLISTEQLKQMKSTAILINSARGPIVDEVALASALHEKEIAGAGMDVFENEPTVHPDLLQCKNCVIVPHIGSSTVETRTRMATMAAENCVAVLTGKVAPNPVNNIQK